MNWKNKYEKNKKISDVDGKYVTLKDGIDISNWSSNLYEYNYGKVFEICTDFSRTNNIQLKDGISPVWSMSFDFLIDNFRFV